MASNSNNTSKQTTPAPSYLQGQEFRDTLNMIGNYPGSPLYGESFKSKESNMVDPNVLHEDEIINTLKYAEGVYEDELAKNGYTALTINSYASATNRFIDFLERGKVIPDFDNKPQH